MSVHQVERAHGRAWEVRWRENGRNRARAHDRKGDADAFDEDVKRRKKLGPLAVTVLTSKGPTLGEWIADRWAPQHAAGLEDSTRLLYARVYASRIEPTLGHLPLQDVSSVETLRRWQTDLLKSAPSVDYVLKGRTVLSSILRHAAEAEAVQANGLLVVRPPAREHADEVVPPTVAEVEAIRAQMTELRDRTIVSVLALAGLRPGEVRPLRSSDVRDRTILVQRAVKPDGRIKPTKNRKARTVTLLEPLAGDVDEWRAERGGRRRDFLFADDGGQPWSAAAWDNWRRRVWRPACVAAGVDVVPRPYDLRHLFASLLLAEGRTIHYVAEELGHTPELTLRVYGHVIDEYAGLPAGQRPRAEDEIRKARA